MVQCQITMSSDFQRTFQHLNAVQHAPPPLVPAPNDPPLPVTSVSHTSAAPPTLQPAIPAVPPLPTLHQLQLPCPGGGGGGGGGGVKSRGKKAVVKKRG